MMVTNKGGTNMKIVFLDAKTIGEDIDLSAYDALGEVVKYGFTYSGGGCGASKGCRRSDRQ